MYKGLFITGTDTGVGKTYVACAILRALRRYGMAVGAMKPVATGDRNDARNLIAASGVNETLDRINPVFLKESLAPLVSARFEGKEVDLKPVYVIFREFLKKYTFTVVEGVGGLLVPLTEKIKVIDMARKLRLPALIVARPQLGTINHTLLTVRELRRMKLEIAGIVLSGVRKTTLAEKTNPSVIRELTGLPVLELSPHGGINIKENPWLIQRQR
ncbi:MAG: dethiobiotin synthase [Elusimicrobiota bacterium]